MPPGVYSKIVLSAPSVAKRFPALLKARPKLWPGREANTLRVPLGVNLKIVLGRLELPGFSDITKILPVLSTARPERKPEAPPKVCCAPLGVNLLTLPPLPLEFVTAAKRLPLLSKANPRGRRFGFARRGVYGGGFGFHRIIDGFSRMGLRLSRESVEHYLQ